jgi:hypothetical protein
MLSSENALRSKFFFDASLRWLLIEMNYCWLKELLLIEMKIFVKGLVTGNGLKTGNGSRVTGNGIFW